METSKILEKIDEIQKLRPSGEVGYVEGNSYYLLALQFVKNYIGKDTEFYHSLLNHTKMFTGLATNKVVEANAVLSSIKNFITLNLEFHQTENYRIKVDIISDFVAQSIELINNKKIHPVASAILLGASLEEFLKQLAVINNIDLTDVKNTIDPISKKLYDAEIITKQDIKDITSWAGLRNDATHGNFDQVNDRNRVQNAIEGVNLFMRKYTV